MRLVAENVKKEQAATILVSVIWYFGWPLFFFIVLAPGFLLSLPPARDCDDGVKRVIAPERTTVANVFVHAAVFLIMIIIMFVIGSSIGIYFPFTAKTFENILHAHTRGP